MGTRHGDIARLGPAFPLALVSVLMLFLICAGRAGAAAPDFLLKIPTGNDAPGGGAGQTHNLRGMATDSTTGHLFAADNANGRIDEFTAWGGFVKAWGWGVVASGPGNQPQNEIQKLTVSATGGSFRLRYLNQIADGQSNQQETGSLAFNASSAGIQAALEGLASFGPGDVSVNGPAGGPWVIEFVGSAADSDFLPLQPVTVDSGGNPTLSGGSASAAVETTQGGANFEICVPANGDVCRAGQPSRALEGSPFGGFSPGQLSSPRGVAVDGAGDVYVYDGNNRRLQKFSSEGKFILMVGGGVNKGPVHPGNVCTAQHLAEGDTCGGGAPGVGCAQFSNGSVTNFVTYNEKSNTIFVGDVDRILELNLDGSCKGQIPFEGALAAFDGKSVQALAAEAATGNLYLAVGSTPNVYRIDRLTGTILDVLPVSSPRELATDVDGNVYVVDRTDFSFGEVLGFDSSGNSIVGMESGDDFPGESGIVVTGLATSAECPKSSAQNQPGLLYANFFSSGLRSYAKGYGSPPICFEQPPEIPPEITAQYAVSADTGGGVVKAQINPNFWPDARYYVQYGPGACSAGGCNSEQPVPPGAVLTSKSTNSPVTTAGVVLDGLNPGTTYHYRFVARSGGGGPVRGVGGTEILDGEEGTFSTFALEGGLAACPANDSFRVGPSEQLPDCRAYELVSPLAKNNADVLTQLTISGFPTAVNQSARSGQRLTYSSGVAFADSASAPFVSQYIADRDPVTGWASVALSPPQTRAVVDPSIDNEFKFFSADLCSGWLQTEFDPPAAPGGVVGFRNLYRRENCGAAHFEALSTAPPPHLTPVGYGIRPQGASTDGSRAIFVANDNLPGTGAPDNDDKRLQLYEHSGAGLRFVCVLPSGNASQQECSAGTADEDLGATGTEQIPNYSHAGSFQNAISASGDRIFWTESSQPGPGRIFVRFAGQGKSARVSQSVSGAKARFWGAAADGSKAIFAFEDSESAQNGNLYSFDVGADKSTLIAGKVDGVLGIAEDALRVYFVSRETIAGAGENSEHDQAVAGEPNLYLFEDGAGGDSYSFVARLPATGVRLSSIATSPFLRTSRVTPDGRHAAFMSSAPLTGYDNTDAVSGKADAEVFLYRADDRRLSCVSCNPSGARPAGVDVAADDIILGGAGAQIWTAAQIPTWERPFYASRVLSEDGRRLFFESFEALVPRDTNGVQDVYQWEAPGSGDCDAGDSSFGVESGGCVTLISSGESPRESSFVDASPSGDDVFIATLSSLVTPDYGLVDVYDARVGGGISYPQDKAPCEGEACQSPPAPPVDPTPASSSFRGAGNVKRRSHCPKGKRRVKRNGKPRCVKKRGKQQRASRGNRKKAAR